MIAPGTRFGNYEVITPLGAAGMGKVYRARDLRLDRAVAVKILPAGFAADPSARDDTNAICWPSGREAGCTVVSRMLRQIDGWGRRTPARSPGPCPRNARRAKT